MNMILTKSMHVAWKFEQNSKHKHDVMNPVFRTTVNRAYMFKQHSKHYHDNESGYHKMYPYRIKIQAKQQTQIMT